MDVDTVPVARKRHKKYDHVVSLLDLPDELVLAILALLPPSAWRIYSPHENRVVNLRETCRRFNDVLDSLVTRLWVMNTSRALTVDVACRKIRRCSATLTSLTLFRMFPTTVVAHDALVDAVNQCTRVTTLYMTPGTGSGHVSHQLSSMTNVEVFAIIPNSINMPRYVREQDGASMAYVEILSPLDQTPYHTVWCMDEKNAQDYSRDPALSHCVFATQQEAKLFWMDSINSTQRVISMAPRDRTNPLVKFLELNMKEFSRTIVVQFCNLEYADNSRLAKSRDYGWMVRGPSRGVANFRVATIENIILPPDVCMPGEVALIRPAVGHCVTLWVPFTALRMAREYAQPGVAVAPVWFVKADELT